MSTIVSFDSLLKENKLLRDEIKNLKTTIKKLSRKASKECIRSYNSPTMVKHGNIQFNDDQCFPNTGNLKPLMLIHPLISEEAKILSDESGNTTGNDCLPEINFEDFDLKEVNKEKKCGIRFNNKKSKIRIIGADIISDMKSKRPRLHIQTGVVEVNIKKTINDIRVLNEDLIMILDDHERAQTNQSQTQQNDIEKGCKINYEMSELLRKTMKLEKVSKTARESDESIKNNSKMKKCLQMNTRQKKVKPSNTNNKDNLVINKSLRKYSVNSIKKNKIGRAHV